MCGGRMEVADNRTDKLTPVGRDCGFYLDELDSAIPTYSRGTWSTADSRPNHVVPRFNELVEMFAPIGTSSDLRDSD